MPTAQVRLPFNFSRISQMQKILTLRTTFRTLEIPLESQIQDSRRETGCGKSQARTN